MKLGLSSVTLLVSVGLGLVQGQASSCTSTLSSKATPSVAAGYQAQLVANQLSDPRGIKFDSAGNLLVVESGKGGITALKISDDGHGCLSSPSRSTVVKKFDLNHGIEMSADGKTLYASSTETAFSWDYDAQSRSTTGSATTLVTNMTNTDHTTRTLLLSRFVDGMLLVTRGSTSNIDPQAAVLSSGHSQVKAFNMNNMSGPYNFDNDGLLLGWGLRNDVGIDEEPTTGAIYTVENSVDEMTRNGKDIHQTNPSEELNMLGYLNGTKSSNQGRNFGYPGCYTAWDISTIPDFCGQVGQHFSIGSSNNDSKCSEAQVQAARLGFHPHMAPLDILFDNTGSQAWITFHGSWDSQPAVGYKLSVVDFANGEPTDPSTSTTAATDILSNMNTGDCANSDVTCFRPVGLAWDQKGRLFMSSDTTGEVYAISRVGGSAINNGTSPSTPTSSGSSGTTSASATPTGAASSMSANVFALLALVFGMVAYVM